MRPVPSEERLQQALEEITRLLEKHRLLEQLAQRQEGPRRALLEHLQHQQNIAELERHLALMHPADVGFVLEALPLDDRRTVWERLASDCAGQVLMEVPPAVRDSLFDVTAHDALVRVLLTLDPEDLAFIADALEPGVRAAISRRLESEDRLA